MDGLQEHGSQASALLESQQKVYWYSTLGGSGEVSQVTPEWSRDKKGRGTRQGHRVEAATPWHYRNMLRGGGVAVGLWRRGHPVGQAGGEPSFALKVLAWRQSDLRQWSAESGQ